MSAQDWDISKIQDLHQWTFRMSQGADSLGYSRWEIRRIGDQILLSEDSKVPSFGEDMFVYVNGKTLAPDSALITGRLSGFPIESKMHFSANGVKGYGNFPKHPSKPTFNLSKPLPEGTKTRLASFILTPFYKDLAVGKSFTYPQFSMIDGEVRTITANIVSKEMVDVKGEQVEAFKLELRGGMASQNIFIDPKRNRIVKITFEENAWVYELIND